MKPNFDKFQSFILRYDQSFQCCTTRKYDSTTCCKLNVYRHHIQDYIENMGLEGYHKGPQTFFVTNVLEYLIF